MHWTYADVIGLPRSVYDVLVALLNTEAEQRAMTAEETWR